MNANIKAIADSANVSDVLHLFRVGFELETQATEGMTANDHSEGDGEIDYDRVNEAAADYATQQLRGYGDSCEALARHADSDDYQAVFATIAGSTILTLQQFTCDEPDRLEYGDWRRLIILWRRSQGILGADNNTDRRHAMQKFWLAFPDLHQSVFEAVQESNADDLVENYSDEYTERGEPAVESLRERTKLEVDTDGSVSGFEFRTGEGGCTVPEFQDAAEDIFSLRHRIDTKCSFHIHVSVDTVKHSYGARLQQTMIAYLAANLHRVPQSVLERWADEAQLGRYFRVDLSTEKFSFVHWHSQGTIEFRCFGNVKNVADAMTCMTLACEAVRYAYQCKAGLLPWPDAPLAILRDDITGRTAAAA